VHKESITAVPNSVQGRSNVEIEIYGMEGIPTKDQEEHAKKMRDQAGPKSKRQKTDDSDDSDDSDDDNTQLTMPGNMHFPGMGMPGMPPMGMPGMMGPMGAMMGPGPMGPMGGPMGMPGPNMRWPMPNQPMMGPGPMSMMGGPGPMGPYPPVGPGGPMGGMPMGPGPNMPPGNVGPRPPGMQFNSGGNQSPNAGGNPAPQQDEPPPSGDSGPDQPVQPSLPKPLFPAASNIPQNKVGQDKAPGAGESKTSSSGPKSISANSRLMHPDEEDLSLEEIRSRMNRFKEPVQKRMPPPMPSTYQSRGTVY